MTGAPERFICAVGGQSWLAFWQRITVRAWAPRRWSPQAAQRTDARHGSCRSYDASSFALCSSAVTCTDKSSSESPRTLASEATVKNAGVGMRPVSILRSVSTDRPAAVATAPMLAEPRAARSVAPSLWPRSISSGVSGIRTMLEY